MPERIKQIPAKLLELWKNLTKKQRIIGISTIVTVVLTLVILIVLLNQIQYEKLNTFEDTATAKQAVEVLAAEGIAYKLEDDNVTVDVDVTKKQDAVLALTGSEFLSKGEMSLAELLENDLSTTSGDKTLKKHLYMQSDIAASISALDGVDKAQVIYFPADRESGILQPNREISCSVFITITDEFDTREVPESIATFVAYAIGNETLDKIKIIDQHGNLLFGGEEEDESVQDLNTNLAYKKTVEKWYNDKLFELAIKNGFFDAEIVSALSVNCDKTSVVYTEYLAAEGSEQGLYDTYKKISSESSGNPGDVVGTDSNDETDYYVQESGSGKSSYDSLEIKYRPSERVTQTMKEWGVIDTGASSLAITLTSVKSYTEEELTTLGLLEGTTFDEYTLTHSDKTTLEIPAEFYELFSDASGIPTGNITITGYEIYNYTASEEEPVNYSLYLEILLAVLILGLLLFVVFRAMKTEEIIEAEPELSVERLLATTRENQSLEDIEFGEKSETRKLIEKYIDENAEAVASLLRNWLSDDGWE